MIRKQIAKNANVIPCFLMSYQISQLSYSCCDVWVKSLPVPVMGFCRNVVEQHGRILRS